MEKITLSVILPVYNVEMFLEECLNSILAQTFEDYEVLCVNDCSTDSSPEILKKYSEKDSRIKIINHSSNLGLGAARNTALNLASGEYVTCIDSDDWIGDTFFEKAIDVFKNNNTNSVWVKFFYYYHECNKFTLPFDNYLYFSHYPKDMLMVSPENVSVLPFFSWGKVFKRSSIVNNNVKWPEKILFEDIPFFFNYFLKNDKIYIINEFLYFYRKRNNSIVTDVNLKEKRWNDMYKSLFLALSYSKNSASYSDYKNAIKKMAKNYLDLFKEDQYYALCKIKYSNFLRDINY